MSETAVTCEVSCQRCGWNTGATIIADAANLFAEILRFLSRCSMQHPSRGPAGKLLIAWEPLEPLATVRAEAT